MHTNGMSHVLHMYNVWFNAYFMVKISANPSFEISRTLLLSLVMECTAHNENSAWSVTWHSLKKCCPTASLAPAWIKELSH